MYVRIGIIKTGTFYLSARIKLCDASILLFLQSSNNPTLRNDLDSNFVPFVDKLRLYSTSELQSPSKLYDASTLLFLHFGYTQTLRNDLDSNFALFEDNSRLYSASQLQSVSNFNHASILLFLHPVTNNAARWPWLQLCSICGQVQILLNFIVIDSFKILWWINFIFPTLWNGSNVALFVDN